MKRRVVIGVLVAGLLAGLAPVGGTPAVASDCNSLIQLFFFWGARVSNVGDVTNPIESPQGFQILRLVSREAARTPAFAEIEPEIRAHLRDQKANDAYLDWIAELRDKIHIRVVRSPSQPGSS